MDPKLSLIEPLLERAEDFGKTSYELLKLKFVSKTADISSTLVSRLLLAFTLLFFVLALNIAFALWLGDLLGKNYFGFLFLALLYGIVGLVILLNHALIKARMNNSIITFLIN